MEQRPDSTPPESSAGSGPLCDQPGSRLAAARRCQEAGELEQAAAIYREILAVDPDHPEATYNLGLIHHARGEFEAAVACYWQVVGAAADRYEVHVNLANALKEAGRLEEAIASYRSAIAIAPDQVMAHQGMGDACLARKMLREAIACYRQVLALEPQQARAWYNLGVACQQAGEAEEAMGCYARVLTIEPNDADSYYNLAILFKASGETDKAIAAYRAASELCPGDPDIHYHLGLAHAERQEHEEAMACYRSAMAADPDFAPACFSLGAILHRQGRTDEAAACYRQALRLGHRVAVTTHLLAALTGENTDQPPAEYISSLFDHYAERFEQSLVTELGYQAPEHLGRALTEVLPPETILGHAVDLGCGTGLSGLPFRNLARRLSGVDLSGRILSKAEEKGIYDGLHQGDLVEFLDRTKERFDLFVAADVLAYRGDLRPLFAAIRKKALPGAYFVLCTEACDKGKWQLRQSGRYAHSWAYLEEVAAENGFAAAWRRRAGIRKEQGEWIEGDLVILRLAG